MSKFDTLERVTLPRDTPVPAQPLRGNTYSPDVYRTLNVPR